MAVTNVSASGSYGTMPGSHGAIGWGMSSMTSIGATIPPANGTAWAVWQVGVVGIPPGKQITGINISGPVSFWVAGTGLTRQAVLYADTHTTFGQFASGVGGPLVTLTGQQSANLNVNISSNLSSDDLLAGNFYLGMAVSTTGDNADHGNGSFSLGALSWTFYTSPDQPQTAPGTPSSRLTNPASNTSPGVFPGGQFLQLTSQLLAPLPQQYYSAAFGVPYNKGFVFVDNGSNSQIIKQQGFTSNPSSPYVAYSGVITVAANTVPGVYTFQCAVSGLSGSEPPNQTVYTQVTVRRRGGGLFVEA
jgi:hypothetical protein